MIKEKRRMLEEYLISMLNIIKYSKEQVESIKEHLFQKGMMKGQIQKIINGDKALSEVDNKTLLLLALQISGETGKNEPYVLFTKTEIEHIVKDQSEISNDIAEKIIFPFNLKNVDKVVDNEYETTLMLDFVGKLYNSSILSYNYTHGNYKLKKNIAGEMNKTIIYNHKKVNETADEILTTKKYNNRIVINVLNKMGNEIDYNEKNKKLTINKSELMIVDGMHDIHALIEVKERDQELNIPIKFEVKHFNESQIKYLINKLKIKGGVS